MKRAYVLGVIVIAGAVISAAANLAAQQPAAGGQGRQGGGGAGGIKSIEKVANYLYFIFGNGGNTGVYIADKGVVLVDTAGRLHTQRNLMDELGKIRRVIGKRLPGAPHETWLVLDATNGQNAIRQAREFTAAVEVTGLVVAKLDGTARGGALFGIRDALRLVVHLTRRLARYRLRPRDLGTIRDGLRTHCLQPVSQPQRRHAVVAIVARDDASGLLCDALRFTCA